MFTGSRISAALLALGFTLAAIAADTPAQRCEKLRTASIPQLAAALEDENDIVKRNAARRLSRIGLPAREALVKALENRDHLVRRAALQTLVAIDAKNLYRYVKAGLTDSEPVIRKFSLETILALPTPRDDKYKALIKQAGADESQLVRNIAAKALWPFFRETTRLRDRSDWDHEVECVKAVKLPKEGWKFSLDASRNLHWKKAYLPSFDDSAWKEIAIEQAWQKAGYDYIGVTWYRREIVLPEKPDGKVNASEICFDGVDESAWVWINGVYVGQHDIGPGGWNKPFALDISKEVKWGAKNQITIRAMNTAHAGGIWKPVRIEALR